MGDKIGASSQEEKKQLVHKNIAEEIYSGYTTFQGIMLYSLGTMWSEDFALTNFIKRTDKQGCI